MKFILGKDTKGVFNNLIKYIKELDFSKKWVVEIKEHKTTRSKEQNALYWKWITCFGDHLGYTKDEIHAVLTEEYLPPIVIDFHGQVITRRESTTNLSVKRFTGYLQKIEYLSGELGVNLPVRDDMYYYAMEGRK